MSSHCLSLPLSLAALLLSLAAAPALAERSDRSQPLEVAADAQGSIDMLKRVVVFSGNVVVTKGSMTIKAERVEVREGANGFRTAVAIGGNRPATFRQKRDGADEYIDGHADRLEYDERGDVIRFIDDATVRRLRGSAVADVITGDLITYNGTTEVFTVSGKAARDGSAASGAGGRVRAVLNAREGTEAAAAARQAPAASAPGSQQ